jgi:hypothetical protein
VKAFHLNDSKKGLGSRVDRHEHIGRGEIGLGAFRALLADPAFAGRPMVIETAKGYEGGVDLDAINLTTLRRLRGEDVPDPLPTEPPAKAAVRAAAASKAAGKSAKGSSKPAPDRSGKR